MHPGVPRSCGPVTAGAAGALSLGCVSLWTGLEALTQGPSLAQTPVAMACRLWATPGWKGLGAVTATLRNGSLVCGNHWPSSGLALALSKDERAERRARSARLGLAGRGCPSAPPFRVRGLLPARPPLPATPTAVPCHRCGPAGLPDTRRVRTSSDSHRVKPHEFLALSNSNNDNKNNDDHLFSGH